ncbi:hydrolase [Streptomyces sp. NBC_00378]|uniref:alpha/beta hydrolase family protein n=1 Tax=unclassified Streptomyces TaxID=2593676 RepID=UPI0022531235|nr:MULTISPECIES: alpha/beta family hydrolase [unclassified Streptomyces]MCX5109486.1 hydrolase [Streptomyces sp. NBC_00378]
MGHVSTTDTGRRAETIDTDAGPARITWFPATGTTKAGRARLVLALGHGAGGGIEARDLQALAAALPAHGVTVALVEQPWRVAGKRLAPAPKTLDTGWRGLWPALTAPGLPVVAGGRSAGARVACRTAAELGAHAVLALSFPLHPPGKPEKSRADELLGSGVPTFVVQGGHDPFGRPAEFPPGEYELAEVPYADHGFSVPKKADLGQDEAMGILTAAVTGWLSALV